MLNGNNSVFDLLKFSKLPYWVLRRSEKAPVIAELTEENFPNITPEESITQLQGIFSTMVPGTYYFEYYNGKNRSSRLGTHIVINGGTPGQLPSSSANHGQNLPHVGSINTVNVAEEVAKAIEAYKREEEIKRIQEENKELRDQVNNGWFRILTRLEPYVEPVMKGIFGIDPQQVQIAGIPEQKTTEQMARTANNQQPSDLNERAEKAISEWVEIDPQAIDLIERIVKLAKENPGKYNMAKSFL